MLAFAIALPMAALACAAEAPSGPAATCGTEPPANGNVVALLSRPFAGAFRLTNYFDHDLPAPFEIGNSVQLNTCGERLAGRIDGHGGYDWLLPTGTPLLATTDGTVVFAGTDPPFWCPVLGRTVSDQLVVSIRSAGGGTHDSQYLHLSRIDVADGQAVTRGQVIGLSGNTGCSTEPHLHFQVRANDGPNPGALIDPYGWSGDEPDPWEQHPQGSPSIWLWRPGEAPGL